jgi:hypothetical protein
VATPHLATGFYLRPTPLGAFRVATGIEPGPEADFVRALLRMPQSPAVTGAVIAELAGTDLASATLLLDQLQGTGWVEGSTRPFEPPATSLDEALPLLLPGLSSVGRALLADEQGFCLTGVGFDPDLASALSAFCADVVSTVERHSEVVAKAIGSESAATYLMGPYADEELSLWPLRIGAQRFVLLVAGLADLDRPELTGLVACLSIRYDRDSPQDHP